ncbi:MAG: LysR family transcriptional regulator [Pseudolabrys sp.]|nr:LysR family transcriptional regulator [Pseudolabrys sp.]
MLYHDLQSLRIFLAACEMRSMSKAAESLNIALSAASRRLSLLESELGTPLIMRRPHGIEPTAAGVTMMNYARDVLRLGDRLKVSLDEHRSGIRGYVRVSASSSVLVQRLAKDLSQFVHENPQIKLDLEERPSSATVSALLSKQADIGIIVHDNQIEGLKIVPYSGDRLAIAVPNDHRFAKRRELKFADILDEDVVALESGTATNKLLTSRAIELGRPMKVRVQVRSFEVMCLMINQGLGIGILPERGARPLSKALGIKLVRLAEPWAQRNYSICVRSFEDIEAPSSRLIAFLTSSVEKDAGADAPAKRKPRRR